MGRFYPFLLAALFIPFAGCQPIVGKLSVARDLVLELTEQKLPRSGSCVVRDGGCGEDTVRRVSTSFHPGVYDAQLALDDSDAMELTLDDGTNGKAVLTIAIPEDTRLPTKSGSFMLTAREAGQPFQVTGTIQTDESRSPSVSGWEQCDRTVKRRICTRGKKTGGNSGQDVLCRYEYHTVYGQRPVEFHHLREIRDVVLAFNAQVTGEKLAEFSGSAARDFKVYDYRGRCHADNFFVHGSVW